MRAGADRPALLDQPELPDEFRHLLPWMAALPCPLTWPELVGWMQATGRNPARWEIDLMMKLDQVRQG